MSQQVDNLYNFTLLFHKVARDSWFMTASMDYIVEKYDKMIGIDIQECDDDLDESAYKLRTEWVTKWRYTPKTPKERALINYLSEINTQNPTPINIHALFTKRFGNASKISNEDYVLHPIFERFSHSYIDGTGWHSKNYHQMEQIKRDVILEGILK